MLMIDINFIGFDKMTLLQVRHLNYYLLTSLLYYFSRSICDVIYSRVVKDIFIKQLLFIIVKLFPDLFFKYFPSDVFSRKEIFGWCPLRDADGPSIRLELKWPRYQSHLPTCTWTHEPITSTFPHPTSNDQIILDM